jgi:hypothetical protein
MNQDFVNLRKEWYGRTARYGLAEVDREHLLR